MSYKFLNWLFRISGHAPSNRGSDKYIPLVCVCLLVMTSNVPYMLLSMNDLGRDSYPLVVATASVFTCNLGSIANANAGEVTFMSLANEIDFDPHVRAIIIIAITYVWGCGIGFFSILMTTENLTTPFRRLINYHFYIIPLLQNILLICSLKKAFSNLNNQIRNVFNGQSSATALSKVQIESILQEHIRLRRTIQKVNSYFCFYNIFFVLSNLLFSINSLLNFLRAIENHDNDRLFEFGITWLLTTPLMLLWLYYNGDCTKEANQMVLTVHENLQVDFPLEIMELVERFSLSHFNNSVAFTAGGFFSLNMGLFTKLVGLSLTYFVVVLQLKEP